MPKATGLGGVFFRTKDPKSLIDWYQTHLGIDLQNGVWMQAAGPTVIAAFEQDSVYFSADKSMMLNFRVDDLSGLINSLEEAGITVETRPEWDSEIGRFARIHDPEGNPVELWEMGPAATG